MDYEYEISWKSTLAKASENFGELLDIKSLLFLIGIQELGKDHAKYKKDEKLAIMHIAVCTLLEQYGYYEYEGRDEDGWPHYVLTKKMPKLEPGHQEILLKKAIIKYFDY